MPDGTTQFLNRMLALDLGTQQKVFNALLRTPRQGRRGRGTLNGDLDRGVEDYKAKKIDRESENVIYKDPERSSRPTSSSSRRRRRRTHARPWDKNFEGEQPIAFAKGSTGKVWGVWPGVQATDAKGNVHETYILFVDRRGA